MIRNRLRTIAGRAFGGPRPLDRAGERSDALPVADALVADGRPYEAVRFLTEANRRERDPRVEQRLVDLRFEAFVHSDWPTERPPWPAVIDDLFPGERIPEITHRDLTAEQLRSGIMRHGSLLVRGLLTIDQVVQLVEDIDKTFEAFDARAHEIPRPDLAGWFEPCGYDKTSNRPLKREAGAVLAVDSPPALFDLIETLQQAGVGRLARDYFGEQPVLLGKKTTLRRVPKDANTGDWHQDGAFMGLDIRSLNVWLPLSHCGANAPGMDIVGRRLDELAETGTEGAYFQWSVGPGVADAVGNGAIVRPIFGPGDALLFDQMCLHRTAVDEAMTQDRYAIETWLFAPSTYDTMTGAGDQHHQPRDQLPLLFMGPPD